LSGEVSFAHLEAGVGVLGDSFGFRDPANDEGILGYGFGWLARDGNWTTQLGLVLLAAAGRPGFPYQRVTVEAEGTTVEVPCCTFVIQPHPGEDASALPVNDAPVLCPGAPLARVAGFSAGTFACAVMAAGRTSLLTAAHVFDFDFSARPVYCGARRVGSVSPRRDDRFDLAWVDLDAAVAAQLGRATPDGAAVAGAGHLAWEDFRHRGRVYRPTQGNSATPWILAGGMTLHLLQRDGAVVTQTEMLMTEGCTHPGDSGTALLDRDGWVLGVLSHGRKEFAFFTSVASLRKSPFWPDAPQP
jgi:hypothetical protein